VVEVGFRLLPGMEPGPLVERIGAAVAGVLADESYELEEINETPPFLLDDDNDFYRDFLRFLGQEEGRSVNYGSDAGWLQRRGLDCLLWGPGDIGVAHRPDEHLDRAELERGGEMLGRAVNRYSGGGR
jgi:acetylornithine deacetylase